MKPKHLYKRYVEYDNNLHDIRISFGYTIQKLAKLVKLHPIMMSNISNGYIGPFYAYTSENKIKPWAYKLCDIFSKKFIEIWPREICNIINKKRMEIGEPNDNDYTYEQVAPEFCSNFTLSNSRNKNKAMNKIIANRYLIILSDREREIVIRYICHSDTLESIGDTFGFTRERIRQIYQIGMDKMQRHYLKFKEMENLID